MSTPVKYLALALFGLFFVTNLSHADDMDQWRKAVVKKIAKYQTYPRSALTREIEGRAKVRLSVDATGAITSHEILEATGEDVLDREIPKLISRLDPLPALPDGQTELTFIIPLNWSLN